MQHANVKLSKNEMVLVTNAQFILTKNLIIAKVYTLFGILSTGFKSWAAQKNGLLPHEALSFSPKISKGESYRNLPWVVLDYPRFYTRRDVLAIRCFFWWGNFFSITIHLSGKFLTAYKPAVNNWIKNNHNNGWYISNGDDAWQHHFETDNYLPLEEMANKITRQEVVTDEREFIKLAKKLPLQQWDNAFDFFTEGYSELLALLES